MPLDRIWARGGGRILQASVGEHLEQRVLLASTMALDPEFGSEGSWKFEVTSGNAYASVADISVLPDGKTIVAASLSNGSNADVVLFRLNVDGTTDVSFGTNGRAMLDLSGADDYARSVVLQSDGKIIVGGTADSGAVLARVTASGSLDHSFGGTGYVRADSSEFTDVLVQPDGKIVAATGRAVARYLSSGQIDISFGTAGVKTIPVAEYSQYSYPAEAIAIQPDGRILTAGYGLYERVGEYNPFSGRFTYKNYTHWSVSRLNASGAMDSGFGDHGTLIVTPGTIDRATSICVLPDGKIAVAGVSATGFDSSHITVRRVLPNGTEDSTFDGSDLAESFIAPATLGMIPIR